MTTIRNVNAVAVTVCALCTLVVSPPDSASAQEYEITLTDVRFDRVEENEDGSYFSYWVRVTATNTGSRDLDAVGGTLFAKFYDGDGVAVGATSQGIFGGRPWPPGEERTDSGFQGIARDNRERVAYYRLSAFAFDDRSVTIRCVGCDQDYRDVPTVTPTPALPLFGAFGLGAGLLAAGRARMRRQA
jgi:hypothetical protein